MQPKSFSKNIIEDHQTSPGMDIEEITKTDHNMQLISRPFISIVLTQS